MQHKSKTLFVLIFVTALLVSGCASPLLRLPLQPQPPPLKQPQFPPRPRSRCGR